MISLETKYMGFTLKNPVIAGASGMTDSLDKLKVLEDNGAGAVVLRSIFEEQILMEADSLRANQTRHSEEIDYIAQYTQLHNLDEYLKMVAKAKKELSIPVIASINCITSSLWTSFAREIEQAGADGLELNIFIIPADYTLKGDTVEKTYFDIISEVKKHVSIPIAVKMSPYFSGLANMIFNLSVHHINGIVLFNRFYSPDVNIDKMAIVSSHVFSTPGDISLPLRWVGILSGHVKCDLAACTGIHDGEDVIKCLLVGAKAVQIASAIYKYGPAHIGIMLKQIEAWMKEHHFTCLEDFTGKLNQVHIKNPILFERTQFMKYFAS